MTGRSSALVSVDGSRDPATNFVTIGSETLPITNWFNPEGEDATEGDEIVAVVAGPDALGQWHVFNLRELQPAPRKH